MFERFVVGGASGAGGVGVHRPPGGVGGQVALVSAHLVETAYDELVQAHEGVGVQVTGVRVVVAGGVEGVPLV